MRIVTALFITFLSICCLGSGALFFLMNYPAIDLEQQSLTAQGTPTIVLDDKGNEWARFQLDRREPVPLQRIPKNLTHAFLATEDRHFFKHNGISWRGIARSTWVNLTHGRIVQGASTITQQLVKLIFLSNEKTLTRKIKEQLTALVLEYQCTKEQILEAYLNNIYCGAGIYGIQAAAQRFWRKNAQDLSLAQCALLAGLVQSPANYCPLFIKNHDICLRRRNLILKLMKRDAFISDDEYTQACAEPLGIILEHVHTKAAHAREFIRQTVEHLVGRDQLYNGGLIIKTTLNLEMQKQAEKTFKQHLAQVRTKAPVDGALITIDAHNGAIKALVGGFEFTESQFNRATQAHRQMGSIFKTFIYASALQQGKHFTDVAVDEPITTIKDWNPNNSTRRFEGPMTLARALATSNNIIAIKTFLEIGAQPVIDVALKCHLPGPFLPYPSLALGCTESSLLQATAAYTIFVNKGIYEQPYIIEWIKNRWGKKIEKHSSTPEQVMPQAICSQMIQALKLVPDYLHNKIQTKWLNVESIGKTGTTNKMRTCWYIGATPSYVTGIYVGCDDNRPLLGIASATRTVAPLWLEFNKAIQQPTSTFSLDPYLHMVTVNDRTGEIARPSDPEAISLLVE
jgi:penicillin-binding protein 1A